MGDPLNRDDELRVANAVASALVAEGIVAHVHEPRHFHNKKHNLSGYSIPMVDVLVEGEVYRMMLSGPIIGPTISWLEELEEV